MKKTRNKWKENWKKLSGFTIKKVNQYTYVETEASILIFSNSYYVKTASRIYYLIGLGYLTIDTLKGILLELEPNLGDEQLMEIVEEVDEDGSGTIDFDGNILHNS